MGIFKTPLYLVTDRHFFGIDASLKCNKSILDDLIIKTVIEAVENGVGMVQLREKECEMEDFTALAKRLHDVLVPYDIPLIINDSVEVALASNAEGLHVGQSDSSVCEARKVLGAGKIIGLSVENMNQAKEANSLDIDYVAASPIYRTLTKTNTTDGFGLDGLKEMDSFLKFPIVAIGGINVSNAKDIADAGADSIAVVSAIMGAKEPSKAAAELLKKIVGAELAWQKRAWINITPVYKKILNLPFLKELESGALKSEIFTYYLAQDTLYLKVFGENMLKMGEMEELAKYKEYFTRFYNETIEFENMLHEALRAKMNVAPQERDFEMGTACREYLNHLCNMVASGNAAKAAVAHLACFWVYAEVGKQLNSHPDNIYKDWIDGYGSEQFAESVEIYLDICCRLAAVRNYEEQLELIDIFKISTNFEYDFWDFAYKNV